MRDSSHAGALAALAALPMDTAPFAEAVERREIVYPDGDERSGPRFSKATFDAIATAAAKAGEREICAGVAIIVEGRWESTLVTSFEEYQQYLDATADDVSTTWLAGCSGNWAAVSTWDGYALVGGPAPFIQSVEEGLGRSFHDQVRDFARDWIDEGKSRVDEAADSMETLTNADFLSRLLSHLYGSERAAAIVIEASHD